MSINIEGFKAKGFSGIDAIAGAFKRDQELQDMSRQFGISIEERKQYSDRGEIVIQIEKTVELDIVQSPLPGGIIFIAPVVNDYRKKTVTEKPTKDNQRRNQENLRKLTGFFKGHFYQNGVALNRSREKR